ncbi:MAG: DUF3574 domain-containing protein [Acetobacteraceae bacterium]|nr:DUF3574 domain-containing protein [Acetobacteraceae bacterium]
MIRRTCLALGLLAFLAGCAPPSPGTGAQCGGPLGPPMLVFDLFFGRAVPGRGDVTDAEWAGFVDRVVTPALPNGFTVFDAEGAWMSPAAHTTIHEHTKVLIVALPEGPESLAAVNRIRSAYQRTFQQQRVGMTVQVACGSF